MKKLVIYDSQYGNTQKVAEAVAKSISGKLLCVSDTNTTDLTGVEILIVGSPTQGGQSTQNIQAFLGSIPGGFLKNVKVAAFDTRFSESKVNFALKILIKTIGYAAPKIAKLLEAKGGRLILHPEGFIVKGKEGPLDKGELERAKKWINL